MEKLYSPEEVAAYLNVKPEAVRIWLRTERIRGSKLGNVWRIKESSIIEFLADKENIPREKTVKTKTIKKEEPPKEEATENDIKTPILQEEKTGIKENDTYEIYDKVSLGKNASAEKTEIPPETMEEPDKPEEKTKIYEEIDKLRAVFDQFDI